jgi:hypothetical protein
LKMQISFTGTSPGPIVEVSGGKKCQMVVSWQGQYISTEVPAIYTSLEREAEDRNDAKAAGLYVFTQDFCFVLAIHMMYDVLPHRTALSCAMQVIIILILNIYPVKRLNYFLDCISYELYMT